MQTLPWLRIVIVFALVGLLTLLAWATPILPERGRLHDLVRSIKGIKQIGVKIDPLPELLEDAGVSAQRIRTRWVERLTEMGLVISGDEGHPQLRLTISATTDAAVPDGVAFNPYLTLEQRVRLPRLDYEFVTPTYVNVMVALETKENLARSVNRIVDRMLDGFIQNRERAEAEPDEAA